MPDQLAHDKIRRIACYRKADALGPRNHGCVDPDHLTLGGDQRTAGVAGIERGIGLDHIIDQATCPGVLIGRTVNVSAMTEPPSRGFLDALTKRREWRHAAVLSRRP